MPKTYSGQAIIRILTRVFSCVVVSQKGSHVKLRRVVVLSADGRAQQSFHFIEKWLGAHCEEP